MLQPLIAVLLLLVMRIEPLKPFPHSLDTTCLQLAPPLVELFEELDLLLLLTTLDLLLLITLDLLLLLITLDLLLLEKLDLGVLLTIEDLLELVF